jgi:hypothetical protein
MNEKKDYLQILIFQILTIPVVSAFFILIKPAKVAALFAGALFLIFGTFALVKVQRQPNSKKNPLLWLLYAHLFLISLPLISVRLFNWDSEFENLLIFGLPAPLFHTLSSYVYMGILALVAFNFWQVRKTH